LKPGSEISGVPASETSVAEVADRRRHQMQPRRRLGGRQQVPGHRKSAIGRRGLVGSRIYGSGFCAHTDNLQHDREREDTGFPQNSAPQPVKAAGRAMPASLDIAAGCDKSFCFG
jgi:hypothetical protein